MGPVIGCITLMAVADCTSGVVVAVTAAASVSVVIVVVSGTDCGEGEVVVSSTVPGWIGG